MGDRRDIENIYIRLLNYLILKSLKMKVIVYLKNNIIIVIKVCWKYLKERYDMTKKDIETKLDYCRKAIKEYKKEIDELEKQENYYWMKIKDLYNLEYDLMSELWDK